MPAAPSLQIARFTRRPLFDPSAATCAHAARTALALLDERPLPRRATEFVK